jgi:hypothetical protein
VEEEEEFLVETAVVVVVVVVMSEASVLRIGETGGGTITDDPFLSQPFSPLLLSGIELAIGPVVGNNLSLAPSNTFCAGGGRGGNSSPPIL